MQSVNACTVLLVGRRYLGQAKLINLNAIFVCGNGVCTRFSARNTGGGDSVIEIGRVVIQSYFIAQGVQLRLKFILIHIGHTIASS